MYYIAILITACYKTMNYTLKGIIPFMLIALLSCDSTNNSNQNTTDSSASNRTNTLPKSAFEIMEWTDLLPKDDLDALNNPPSYIDDIEDGSPEDQISGQIQNAITAASDDRYQQALSSKTVITELDGKAVRIAGFIVPLEFNDQQIVTEFFLVPYFGACIHVPPPPPNQIIFVQAPEGINVEALYDPFWISGILSTSITENDIATSAYSIKMHHYEPYTETVSN